MAVLGNQLPESVEEAKALVPSLGVRYERQPNTFFFFFLFFFFFYIYCDSDFNFQPIAGVKCLYLNPPPERNGTCLVTRKEHVDGMEAMDQCAIRDQPSKQIDRLRSLRLFLYRHNSTRLTRDMWVHADGG